MTRSSVLAALALCSVLGAPWSARAGELLSKLALAAQESSLPYAAVPAPAGLLEKASTLGARASADFKAMFPLLAPVLFRSSRSSAIDLEQPVLAVLLDPRDHAYPIAYAASVTSPRAFLDGLGTASDAGSGGVVRYSSAAGEVLYGAALAGEVVVSADRELLSRALAAPASRPPLPAAPADVRIGIPVARLTERYVHLLGASRGSQGRIEAWAVRSLGRQIQRLQLDLSVEGEEVLLQAELLPTGPSALARWLGAQGAGSDELLGALPPETLLGLASLSKPTPELTGAIVELLWQTALASATPGETLPPAFEARDRLEALVEPLLERLGARSVLALLPHPSGSPGLDLVLYSDIRDARGAVSSLYSLLADEAPAEPVATADEAADPALEMHAEMLQDEPSLPSGTLRVRIRLPQEGQSAEWQEIAELLGASTFTVHVAPLEGGILLSAGLDSAARLVAELARLRPGTGAAGALPRAERARPGSRVTVAAALLDLGDQLQALPQSFTAALPQPTAEQLEAWYGPADQVQAELRVEGLAAYLQVRYPLASVLNAYLGYKRLAGQLQSCQQKAYGLLSRKQYAAALSESDRCVEMAPGNATSYVHRGIAYREKGELARALADFGRAMQLAPESHLPYLNRARTHQKLNETDKAIADLERAFELGLEDAHNRLVLGHLYFTRIKYREAVAAYTEAIRLQPDGVSGYLGRGKAYHGLKQLDRALRDFERAVELAPEDASAYHGRARCFLAMGKLAEALADFTRAIDLEPSVALHYEGRARVYSTQDDFEQALPDLTRVVELQPQNTTVLVNRGYAYQALGRQAEAIEDYTRALELDPTLVWAYNNRADALHKAGKLDEALEDANRALELEDLEASVYDTRGSIYVARRLWDPAIADLTIAIELEPDKALFHYNRGLAYFGKGELDRARADYDRAVELDAKYAQQPYAPSSHSEEVSP